MTNLALLAQAAGWGIGEYAIALVVVLGIIAIVYAGAQQMGVPIPPILIRIVVIVLVVVICVVAIRFLLRL